MGEAATSTHATPAMGFTATTDAVQRTPSSFPAHKTNIFLHTGQEMSMMPPKDTIFIFCGCRTNQTSHNIPGFFGLDLDLNLGPLIQTTDVLPTALLIAV